MTAELETPLLVRLETTLRKFERQMARAKQVGGNTATGIEDRFTKMSDRIGRSSGRAATGLQRVMNVSGRGRFVIQNTANQFGDMAVQISGGTDAMRAASQQLPQMLGAFGALSGTLGILGPLLGTVAAIGLPLAAVFLSMGDGADEASGDMETLIKKTQALESAMSDLKSASDAAAASPIDLLPEYGAATARARELLEIQRQIAAAMAQSELTTVSAEISKAFGDVTLDLEGLQGMVLQTFQSISDKMNGLDPSAVQDLARQFGLTVNEAMTLADALRNVGEADTAEDQAEAVRRLIDLLTEAAGGVTEADEETLALLQSLLDAEQAALKLAAVDLVSNIASGADEAARLFTNLQRAAIAAERALALEAAVQSVGGNEDFFDPRGREVGSPGSGRLTTDRPNPQPAARARAARAASRRSRSGGRSRGGRAKGRSAAAEISPVEAVIASAEREVEVMRRRLELLGKTNREVATLEAKYKLLDQAKQKNLDVDKETLANGQTLRQAIEEQAEAIAELTMEYEHAADRAHFFDTVNRELKDGILDAIVEGKNLSDVLEQVAKSFARAALEAALFGSGPFSGGSGGGLFGGLLSGLFSFDGGGHTGKGARVGGVDGKGGFPAILHPQEQVIDLTKTSASAPAGAAVGGAREVHIHIHSATGNQEVMTMTRQGIAAGLAEYDRKLPVRIREIRRDPRRV